jgi:integrase/recombinase XerD
MAMSRPAVPPHSSQGMALYDASGARRYAIAGERAAFLRTAEREDRQVRTLCMTLVYSGCRLSEALAPHMNDMRPILIRFTYQRR